MLKRDVCPSNFNWNIWNWNAQLVFYLFSIRPSSAIQISL